MPAAGVADRRNRQHIAVGGDIHIGVVGQQGRRRNGDRRVFIGGRRVVGCHWRVVDGIDGDVDGCRVGAAVAVTQHVIETVGPIEVGSRVVRKVTVALQRHGAAIGGIEGASVDNVDDIAVINIAVVGEYISGNRRIFSSGEYIIPGFRCVVCTCNRQTDR